MSNERERNTPIGGQTEERPLNIQSILAQFRLIEKSIHRAKLPFETEMLHPKVLEVTMYELLKSREQMLNLVKEIGFPRFEPVVTKQLHIPDPKITDLNVCEYCGSPDCQSDHK